VLNLPQLGGIFQLAIVDRVLGASFILVLQLNR